MDIPPYVERVQVGPASASELCTMQRASLSPSGARVVLSRTNKFRIGRSSAPLVTGSIIVGDTDCLVSTSNCQLWSAQSVAGISAAQWSREGEALLVTSNAARADQKRWASRIQVRSSATAPYVIDAARFEASPFEVVLLGSASWPSAASFAEHIDRYSGPSNAELYPVSLTLAGSTVLSKISERKDTLALVDEASEFRPGDRVDATYGNQIWRISAGASEVYTVADGQIVSGKGSPSQNFAGPIADAKSGRLVGTFYERTVSSRVLSAKTQGLLSREASRYPDAILVSGSIATPRRGVFLMRAISGDLVVVSVNGKAVHSRRVSCRGDAVDTPELAVTMEDWGRPGRPLPVARYRTGARTLVIYFHGGPRGSARALASSNALDRLLSRGVDVAAVEYSGSPVSAAVMDRLSAEQATSITGDVADIVQRLASVRDGYDRLYVYSESYGGLYAVALDNAYGDRIAGNVMVAPWLYVDDRDVSDSPITNDYQRKYVAKVFGWRTGAELASFKRFLETTREGWHYRPGRVILAAEKDRVVDAEKIASFAQAHGATAQVLPRHTHDSVVASDELAIILDQSLREVQ